MIHTYHAMNGGGTAYAAFFGNVEAKATIAGHGSLHSSTFSRTGGYKTVSVMKNLFIKFSDPSVNGGALTDGFLKVTGSAQEADKTQRGFAQISLDSFSYNQAMASVPEGGSTLALLALGAGGVIAFRQRRKTA
jgi:hypothetical protein